MSAVPAVQPMTGAVGERIVLSVAGAVMDEPFTFALGDICSIGPVSWRYKVVHVDGDIVTFEAIESPKETPAQFHARAREALRKTKA